MSKPKGTSVDKYRFFCELNHIVFNIVGALQGWGSLNVDQGFPVIKRRKRRAS